MTTLERAAPLAPAGTARPVLVIIGPSGGGKSTVVRALAEAGVVRVHPTWTTRPRRPDEALGSPEHRFVTEEAFERLRADGFFLDTVALFGLPYRYGLPAITVRSRGPLDTVMLRAPLVARFERFFPDPLVYQVEDRPERVEARLRARGSDDTEVAARLADNEREVELGRRVARRVFENRASLADVTTSVATALAEDLS